jgi:hypothetical protein
MHPLAAAVLDRLLMMKIPGFEPRVDQFQLL